MGLNLRIGLSKSRGAVSATLRLIESGICNAHSLSRGPELPKLI